MKLIEKLREHPRQPAAAAADHRRRAEAPCRRSSTIRGAPRSSSEEGELSIEDLIADEDVAVTVTDTGYIKRTPITTYRNQRRGGKGRIGMRTARRGRRQPPLRGLDALLHDDLHRTAAAPTG